MHISLIVISRRPIDRALSRGTLEKERAGSLVVMRIHSWAIDYFIWPCTIDEIQKVIVLLGLLIRDGLFLRLLYLL